MKYINVLILMMTLSLEVEYNIKKFVDILLCNDSVKYTSIGSENVSHRYYS